MNQNSIYIEIQTAKKKLSKCWCDLSTIINNMLLYKSENFRSNTSHTHSHSRRSTMVYSTCKQQRIIYFYSLGYKSTSIVELLREESLNVKVSAVCRLIKKYKEMRTIARRMGSGRPTKITPEVLRIVEEQMKKDDETTAVQLQKILVDKGHALSLKTILTSRLKLGWTFRGSAHCQVIRDANK